MKTIHGAMIIAGALALTTAATDGQAAQEIRSEDQCIQFVADARQARQENPDIGDKAAKTFDELVELASQRCEEKQFDYASQLLAVARGMVASE